MTQKPTKGIDVVRKDIERFDSVSGGNIEIDSSGFKSPPRKNSGGLKTQICDVCGKRGAYYIKGCGHKLCTNCGDEDSFVCLVCGEESEVNKLSTATIGNIQGSSSTSSMNSNVSISSVSNPSVTTTHISSSGVTSTVQIVQNNASASAQQGVSLNSSSEPDRLYYNIKKLVQDSLNMLELREMQKRKALESRFLDDIDTLRNENLQLREKLTKIQSQKDSLEKRYQTDLGNWEVRRKQLLDRVNELSASQQQQQPNKIANIPKLNLNLPLRLPANVNDDNMSSKDDFEINLKPTNTLSSSSATSSSRVPTGSSAGSSVTEDSVSTGYNDPTRQHQRRISDISDDEMKSSSVVSSGSSAIAGPKVSKESIVETIRNEIEEEMQKHVTRTRQSVRYIEKNKKREDLVRVFDEKLRKTMREEESAGSMNPRTEKLARIYQEKIAILERKFQDETKGFESQISSLNEELAMVQDSRTKSVQTLLTMVQQANIELETTKQELKKILSSNNKKTNFSLFKTKDKQHQQTDSVGSIKDLAASSEKAMTSPSQQLFFGTELSILMQKEPGQEIPKVINQIFEHLSKYGSKTQGLFRITPNRSMVESLKDKINKDRELDPKEHLQQKEEIYHELAAILKIFFREMPVALLRFENYEKFLLLIDEQNEEKKLKHAALLLKGLPKYYCVLSETLLKFLNTISKNSAENMMDPENLAVVFGMNILRMREDNPVILLRDCAKINAITSYLINNASDIFNSSNKK